MSASDRSAARFFSGIASAKRIPPAGCLRERGYPQTLSVRRPRALLDVSRGRRAACIMAMCRSRTRRSFRICRSQQRDAENLSQMQNRNDLPRSQGPAVPTQPSLSWTRASLNGSEISVRPCAEYPGHFCVGIVSRRLGACLQHISLCTSLCRSVRTPNGSIARWSKLLAARSCWGRTHHGPCRRR